MQKITLQHKLYNTPTEKQYWNVQCYVCLQLLIMTFNQTITLKEYFQWDHSASQLFSCTQFPTPSQNFEPCSGNINNIPEFIHTLHFHLLRWLHSEACIWLVLRVFLEVTKTALRHFNQQRDGYLSFWLQRMPQQPCLFTGMA